MDQQNPKQQVAEKLRSSVNVLITVSKNPSVDQLVSAIGLSMMLNALGKHTATVYSGSTPDIISFLEPEKTFDSNVDGLRDFIISLSKDKADKLRYKVEDNVVKIFITPYKTRISENDLDFSQGDYNVDAVIALGVKQKGDLDDAIINHGRILHDATVISVNAGAEGGNIGAIDWTDPSASCLSEMLVSISEALEGGILDASMSTAFLTGIVSVTERFSNDKTTPKLMTMAAQLMAAGANQQLISEKLQIGLDASSGSGAKLDKADQGKEAGTLELDHSEPSNDNPKPKDDKQSDQSDEEKRFHELDLSSLEQAKGDEVTKDVDAHKNVNIDELEKKLSDVSEDINNPTKTGNDTSIPLPAPDEGSLKDDNDQELSIKAENPNLQVDRGKNLDIRGQGPKSDFQDSPSLGGTFNATSKDAQEEKKKDLKDGLNDEILTHDIKPLNNDKIPQTETHGVDLKPIGHLPDGYGGPKAPEDRAPELKITPPPGIEQPQSPPPQTAAVDNARRAVEQAMTGAPFNPANNPVANLNSQPIPPTQPAQGQMQPMAPAAQAPGSSVPPVMPPPMPQMAPPPAPAAPQQFQPQQPQVPMAPPQPQILDPSPQSQTFNIPGAPQGTPPQAPPQNPIMHQPPPQQIQPNGDVPPPPQIGGLPPAPS